MSQFNQHFITSIIDRYGLEFEDERIESIVATWIGQYDRVWIVKAIVESLHRGRYKIKSVDNILSGWQRTGKPSYNFPPEFEREILQDLPTMGDLAETQVPPTSYPSDDLDRVSQVSQFSGLSSEQLNPEESAPFPYHDRTTPPLQPPIIERDSTPPQPEINSLSNLKPPAVVSFNREDEDPKPHQIISHPKFQLFHTLRAIITPNNLPAIKPDDLDLPSYSTDLA